MKTPNSPGEQSGSSIEDAAVDWAVRRACGLTAPETAELLRWLEADTRHALALDEAEKTVHVLCRPRETGVAAAVLRELRARQEFRRACRRTLAWTAGGLGLAASIALALLPAFRTNQSEALAPGPTVVVRPDRQALPDGSVVQLNAGAEIRVAFTPDRRSVELVRGEALFSVTSDAARPFVVAASGVEVRAVGTEFSVRHAAATVDVLVTQGRVAVVRTPPPATANLSAPASFLAAAAVYVAAGSRLRMPVEDVDCSAITAQPITASEIAGALAWRDKRLEFTGTPLGEAVALFNRANQARIVLADPTLASMRISGVFWRDDPDAFSKLLEMSLNLVAERPDPDRIVLGRMR